MTIVIASEKTWNKHLAHDFRLSRPNDTIHIIDDKRELSAVILREIHPTFIFFPHWSSIIPSEIYENYQCIVFHMTDLPFGRGGSPLQNLITRGIKETRISAVKVVKKIDAGDIYLKEPLSLLGSAEEIYIRASEIIFGKMIPHIIDNSPVPIPQVGEITNFARRTPDMSELLSSMTETQIFDHIRMLDAEGYPKAFIKFGEYTLRFSRAKRTHGGIIADVEIGGYTEND